VKFNAYSDEQSCGRRVPGEMSDKYSDLGGLACMRTAGHIGECIAVMRDAGIADGARWCCRVKLDEAHAAWCPSRSADRAAGGPDDIID
jgi:hypothetical protein